MFWKRRHVFTRPGNVAFELKDAITEAGVFMNAPIKAMISQISMLMIAGMLALCVAPSALAYGDGVAQNANTTSSPEQSSKVNIDTANAADVANGATNSSSLQQDGCVDVGNLILR